MTVRSIGIRLSLFQVLVTGIGGIAILFTAYHLFVSDIQSEQDRGIREIAAHLRALDLPDPINRSSLMEAVARQKQTSTFRGDFPWFFISQGDSILFSSDAREVATSSFEAINDALKLNPPVDSSLRDVTIAGELYRCSRVSIQGSVYLTVIYSWDDLSGPAERAELVVAILMALLLVLISIGNLFLTRIALKPVDDMVTAMNAIIDESARPTEYSELMPVHTESTGPVNEIESLRNTFAQMLSRLHETAIAEYRFIADTVHDIANPLTVLRTEIEMDPPAENNPEELEQFQRSIRQLDEIQQLSSELSLLAHYGLSGGRQTFVPVSMSEVIIEEGAELMARASRRHVAIVTDLPEEAIICIADANMVRRVVRRVLGNVLAETTFGSEVRIELSTDEKFAVVTIAEVSERETNLNEPSESVTAVMAPTSGHTTVDDRIHGIVITREVIRLQGGSVEIETPDDAGIIVTLRFPLCTPDLRLS